MTVFTNTPIEQLTSLILKLMLNTLLFYNHWLTTYDLVLAFYCKIQVFHFQICLTDASFLYLFLFLFCLEPYQVYFAKDLLKK